MRQLTRIIADEMPALKAFLDARASGADGDVLKSLASAAQAENDRNRLRNAPSPTKPKFRLVVDKDRDARNKAELIRIRRFIWNCDKLIASCYNAGS
jgi:hypothetical protein